MADQPTTPASRPEDRALTEEWERDKRATAAGQPIRPPMPADPVRAVNQLFVDTLLHLHRIQARMVIDLIGGGYTGRMEDYRDGGRRA
jgi:hypothetical protein